MDKRQVKDAQVEIKKERKRTENLITQAKSKSQYSESFHPFLELNSELTIQEDLCNQLEQSVFRVSKIKSLLNPVREVTSGAKVATNPLVVGRLLQFMDKEQLLKCRLVSSLWNDEIIRLATEVVVTSYIEEDSHPFGILSPPRDLNELAEGMVYESGMTLRDFHLLLDSSKHPEFLMKKLEISRFKVDGFNAAPLNIFECEMILRKYGHGVTELEITSEDKNFNILSRCLGQSGYCPNLQDLTISIHDTNYKDELPVVFEQPFVRNLGSLKLKNLSISYDDRSVSSPQSSLLKVFHHILENSSGIEHLNIEGNLLMSFGDWNWKTPSFTQVLKSNSDVVKNLKSLEFQGTILESLRLLAELPFEGNLKMILLKEIATKEKDLEKVETMKKKNEESFVKLLERLSPSLEYCSVQGLGLSLDCSGYFPLMPELKFFVGDGPPPECLAQFLKKLPSLKAVGLGGVDSLEDLLERCWKDGKKREEVHEELEQICIQVISSPGTIPDLNVAFPKLSELHIDPKLGAGVSSEEVQTWFEQAFEFISQINCLKSIGIHFENWECGDLPVDFKKAFSILRKAPKLEKVTIYNLDEDGFKCNLMADSLPAIVGAPKLRRIIFPCAWIQRKDYDLKEKLTQVKIDFTKNGIHLEFD